ncbi:MAG: hypothetical protein R2745_08015 [Vicinamibacterales bacterium]
MPFLARLRISSWTRVPEFLGWSPGLRFARGHRLPCGCLAGIYWTWSGHEFDVLDARCDSCRLEGHRVGLVLSHAGPAARPGA